MRYWLAASLSCPASLCCRAYCAKADAAWPPIWACGAYVAGQYATGLPFWVLLLLLFLTFVSGMYLCSVHLAGACPLRKGPLLCCLLRACVSRPRAVSAGRPICLLRHGVCISHCCLHQQLLASHKLVHYSPCVRHLYVHLYPCASVRGHAPSLNCLLQAIPGPTNLLVHAL